MLVNRTDSTLLEGKFAQIVELLNPGDLLVLNDAKVLPARLTGHKPTGGKVEVLLLEERSSLVWEVMVRPGKRIHLGNRIFFDDELSGQVEDYLEGGRRLLRFECNGELATHIDRCGRLPLPPYIAYEDAKQEYYAERYQTVYAAKSGAVAAPTAGLHFSVELLKCLKLKGVSLASVTLYVGMGTFKPIDVEDISKHQMHSERYDLPPETVDLIDQTHRSGHKVTAVGTTVVRVLEGVMNARGRLEAGSGRLDLFITPGFKFKVVDQLITNFHLPRSSLLVLVSAFAGTELIQKAYQKAIEDEFRFYSFGDAMLIR